jgi:energy-coupling factor transporter ATP-binding protein EcfA2
MDFYQCRTRETRNGTTELYPGFTVGRSTDLMVRGGKFYAIWDEAKGLWSTDEYDVARLVDEELMAFAAKSDTKYFIRDMRSHETGSWSNFKQFLSQVSDNSKQLDQNLTFANTEVKKTDYVSRRLSYALAPGDHSAWNELVGTLYSVEERAKIEWVIGAIVSGDSKKIQKFAVFYGPPGSGKSTMLNIIEKLLDGYTTTFEAKALGSSSSQFATEVFKNNPLAAIQHDGDLSRIEDNARLNSIISHEDMTMNEKFKSSYTSRVNAFLLMGTNQPVKISDAKSGIIRRLIDIHPTGVKIPVNHYNTLMSKIDFELGAIAQHCLDVYLRMGKNYYNSYRPLEMMLQTDVFFNFIESYFDIFKEQNGTSLKQAYTLYKEYCNEAGIERPIPQYKFREELRNYFDEFKDRGEMDGQMVRSYYHGFNANKFKAPTKDAPTFSIVIEETVSLLDDELAEMPAQEASKWETPKRKWDAVTTTLKDVDTSELHFVKVPPNHIVIDFDLKGEDGEKSLERNLEAASVWPATYAELSKSGEGVHLHYNYDGDSDLLRSEYSEGIEVKVYRGDASLRRRLTKCNHIPIATINSGLPLKEKKKMLDVKTIQSEKSLRDMIARNLKKEFHAGTKPSVDFIKKILDDAYESGMSYDLTDLRPRILAFAQGSTNQPLQALKVVQQMRFKGQDAPQERPFDEVAADVPTIKEQLDNDDRLAIFDIEVYPNLFVVCWKFVGESNIVRMINPKARDIEHLLKLKLVGFNNRRYDNHILYAAFMGYNNEQLYKLSQKIINNDQSALFGEAYNLSYADIYDFSSKKQGLKKFMIELGLPHMEMDISWDEPVPEEMWDKVVEYCCNDVMGTEGVLEARKQDLIARQILADLSGLTVNDTTQKHTARIIFGQDRNPQAKFIYTDLSKEFPGYSFDMGKSHYRGELVGEGGYVYAEPGMYENVAVLDIASMHPTTITQLNLFGEYTPNFTALKDARVAIKRKQYDEARKMLGGKLVPYLENVADADALAYALKIVINIVYGLTSAKFDNPFRHVRNKDNIVAKRGALFMIDLKHYVQEELGQKVVHIKTDSIKIPDATPEQIQKITEFGAKYGYDFEHEDTYKNFCLVNDAVYIAKKENDKWEAVGAQFQHPYVYKSLFSGERVEFDDLCETKQVTQGAMYLDFEHDTPMVTAKEGLRFVGRTGRFVPVQEGQNGAKLYRVKDDKHYAVTGTKDHLWMEASMVDPGIKVDMTYFESLADKAAETIWKFGNYDEFIK